MKRVSHFRLMPVKHGRGKGPQLSVPESGGIDESWRVIVGGVTCDVVGECVGQVLTDVDTRPVVAPLNPITLTPYFVLRLPRSLRAGDVLMFRTESATAATCSFRVGAAASGSIRLCIPGRGWPGRLGADPGRGREK